MSETIKVFRHFSRAHSAAVRRQENMRAMGSEDQRTNALAAVQEIENEVAECLRVVKTPSSMRSAS